MPSFGKRIDGVGGRRSAPREPAFVQAAITTLRCSRSVVIEDVSATGARLRDCGSLRTGDEVWLKRPPMDAFATVVWEDGDSCGLRFDDELSDWQVKCLGADVGSTQVTRLSRQARLAAEDWTSGLAR